MRFEVYTLVDITCTGARRGEDPVKYKQQQNYLTVLNTIGLRVNPIVKKDPKQVDDYPSFGKHYDNIDNVWMLEFEIDYGATSIDLMQNDFNLVPFFTELEETTVFENDVFITQNENLNNIVFVEKE
jgi:hypothetical protein